MSTLSYSFSQITSARIGKLFAMLVLILIVVIFTLSILAPRSWWQTPDQQAQALYERGDFTAAAKLFTSSQRRGAALYRAGEFEAAANAFARVNSAQGHFNRGNALVMRGKYTDAITAYERALELKPDWPEAANNLEIAKLRAESTKLEGGDMTGGQMGADEIVFDTTKRDSQNSETEQVEGAQELSDMELQALWLRRVQTKPADFLRAKFAFQLAASQAVEGTP
ncbi:MAG: tetratricopeptide repeat protein [Gammaproteobacteria bacterium]|nr:tetratricopeptide repeat protein [Gammaproteobacteria bacterium]